MSNRRAALNWPFAAGLALLMLALWLVSLVGGVPEKPTVWFALTLTALVQAATATLRLPAGQSGWQSGWQAAASSSHALRQAAKHTVLKVVRPAMRLAAKAWPKPYWPQNWLRSWLKSWRPERWLPEGWWQTEAIDGHLTWMLCWTAQVYSLGILAWVTPTPWAMLPAILFVATIEWLLWPWAPGREDSLSPGSVQAGELEAESGVTVQREQTQGRLLDGQTFQSGWVRIGMDRWQKSASLSVIFSPPYLVPPDVELDWEVLGEAEVSCEARLEHVSPAGMRVSLKRDQASEQLEVKLLWNAQTSQSHVWPPVGVLP